MHDTLEQLWLLKDLTRKTGILHEAQVIQLKHWPIALTHATKVEVSFNWEKIEVIFNLLETEGRKPKDFKKRLEFLSIYTNELLGGEYTIIVKLKNKTIFKSKVNSDAKKQAAIKRKQLSSVEGETGS